MVLFNAKKNAAAAVVLVDAAFARLMMQSYRVYHPVPASVWQEMHVLHQYAEEQGFLGEVVDTESNLTMRDLYAEALLVSLADPYRLMSQELDRVCSTCCAKTRAVELRNSAEGLNPQRLFIIGC